MSTPKHHTYKVVYRTKNRKYVIRKLSLKDKKSVRIIPYTGTYEECESYVTMLNNNIK